MKIIVDAHGGDNAPLEVLKGCAQAVELYGVEILLCGQIETLKEMIAKHGISDKNFSYKQASQVITGSEEPVAAIKTKKDSSIVVALQALKQEEGDAFVSAGNTGAVLTGATLIIKRIQGIKRAALAPLLPTEKTPCMLIDCGANVEAKPDYFLQFGQMGSIYMKKFLNIENPKVGLLNIGAEETKGTSLQKEAYVLLKNSSLNFVGNIEGREVSEGVVDVIVADGFTGNIFLKTFEGVALFMLKNIKEVFSRNALSKFAALLVMPGLKAFKKKLDYKEYGGTIFLGISKPVIKAHGSSDSKAFCSAIKQAIGFVQMGVIDVIQSQMEENEENLSK